MINPLMEVKKLRKYFPVRSGFWSKVTDEIRAVDGVDFQLFPGESLGLVGESGCGKTTVARTISRIYPPTSGEIWFDIGEKVNLATLPPKELAPFRRHIQMVFQDPYASLSPRMTVGEIIAEPLIVQKTANYHDAIQIAAELLVKVGLNADYIRRYPHAFSGGQRQRIAIARALALKPELVILDEPVSALDLSVQAQILNLLAELRESNQLTYLFIGHNLHVVRHICSRVAVMYRGRIVELAATEELWNNPLHPYTQALLSSMPSMNPAEKLPEIEKKPEFLSAGELKEVLPGHWVKE